MADSAFAGRGGWRRFALGAWLAACCGLAQAGLGLAEIPAATGDGPVTLYYPTDAPDQTAARGFLSLPVAPDAAPVRGNGRLVVVSHGTGGSPWAHANLARALVEAGFVVALPLHQGDNYLDHSRTVESLERRPGEVSRAIDAVGRDARFAPLLALDRVGVYGFSAGGFTALTFAGGRWSKDGFRQHCEANLADDFLFCAGLSTRLTGGVLDGTKLWLARTIIGWRFADTTVHGHEDPRVVAAVAAMPVSAMFDMASLAAPRIPLGLVSAQEDRWLVPRFHVGRVLQACRGCEHLADLPRAGHGAMLSPLPAVFTGLLGEVLNDPPGFDRSVLPELDRQIAAFFMRHVAP